VLVASCDATELDHDRHGDAGCCLDDPIVARAVLASRGKTSSIHPLQEDKGGVSSALVNTAAKRNAWSAFFVILGKAMSAAQKPDAETVFGGKDASFRGSLNALTHRSP
jgi:hypothetical protein